MTGITVKRGTEQRRGRVRGRGEEAERRRGHEAHRTFGIRSELSTAPFPLATDPQFCVAGR